jgi:N-acetyl-anhydromuramyl-L-alanine amidase AmpD
MNAVQLLNIYAPYYANPTIQEESKLKGKSIWSGHLLNKKPSFICYHWLMRMDGSFERLLKDEQIGWHAGNWDINKKSVAICLDNDYEERDPGDEVLQKLADFIKKTYPNIKPENIIGHKEARKDTICPGANFLDGWKAKLIGYVEQAI